MGSKWPIYSLENICDGIFDCPHSTPELSSYGHYMVRTQDIRKGYFDTSDAVMVNSQVYKERTKRVTPKFGDLLFSREGTYFGDAAEVPENMSLCLGQRMVLIRPNPNIVSSKYLRIFINSEAFQRKLLAFRDGTVAERLNLPVIRQLPIEVPPMQIQKTIEKKYCCLEEKEHINRQINQTLEQMAQTLFKSWFVDFDPVIDNALNAGNEIPEPLQARAELRQKVRASQDFQPLPADVRALFPTEFEESELGWVPKGWDSTPVIELIELIGGGTPKTSIEEYWNGDIPWFSVVDAPNDGDIFVIDTEKHITQLGVDSSSTKILRKGTTIISARGTVGKCAFVARPMAMNQSCYGVIGVEGVTDEFVYYLLKQSVQELQQRSHGSVFSTITRDTFRSIQVPFSGGSLTRSFSSLVSIMFEKVLANNLQNIELIQLRDTLLPKLISGELRLDDLSDEVVTAANE